jgi:hypothetical protein
MRIGSPSGDCSAKSAISSRLACHCQRWTPARACTVPLLGACSTAARKAQPARASAGPGKPSLSNQDPRTVTAALAPDLESSRRPASVSAPRLAASWGSSREASPPLAECESLWYVSRKRRSSPSTTALKPVSSSTSRYMLSHSCTAPPPLHLSAPQWQVRARARARSGPCLAPEAFPLTLGTWPDPSELLHRTAPSNQALRGQAWNSCLA